MASKTVFFLLASVLLIQTSSGQCINNVVAQPILNGNGCGGVANGLGYASAGSRGLNLNFDLPGSSGSAGTLVVSSGSALTPNGLRFLSENLELGGEVAVTGTYPFITAVGVDGVIPTGGGASISYSSAPGVGLSNAGCGLGLSGAPGAPLAGNSLAGVGVGNLIGASNNGIPRLPGCGGVY